MELGLTKTGVFIILLMTFSSAFGSSPPPHRITEAILKNVAGALTKYVDPLPRMPVLYAYEIKGGRPVSANLTVGMFVKKWKFHRDLPATTVFAYGTSAADATFPGPTIEILQGTSFWVTWQNHLPFRHILPLDPTIPLAHPSHGGVPTVVHLHGGVHEPQSDGNPHAWFTAGELSTGPAFSSSRYRYAAVQPPGNLWYHDHSLGLTRVNLLAGLIGTAVVRNPTVELPLCLPTGPDSDLHLVLADRSFAVDGSLFMNDTGDNPHIHPQWQPVYLGNAVVVNGKAWPFLVVRRRRYRLRILNASNARFFTISFSDRLLFTVIGSDATYLNRPAVTSSFTLSPAEIFDVLVDFRESRRSEVELVNTAPFPYPGGAAPDELTGKVMKFRIEEDAGGGEENKIPKKLVEYPTAAEAAVAADMKRYITMYEYDDKKSGAPTGLLINGKKFDDPVTERPAPGTTEVWEVINLTTDTHPLHIHLGFSQALGARKLVNLKKFKECMGREQDAVRCNVAGHATGKMVKTPKHERSWKNVVKVAPGYMTTVVVAFRLPDRNAAYPFDSTTEPGYVYHCHVLDHEDNEMIRPLKLIS